MIRLAMLSFWHVHAGDYARQAQEHPKTEIVACWDEVPERGREQAAKYDLTFVEDLDELLARSDVDGVIVDAPTSMHPDVIGRAARAGKHIFTEKVLALGTDDCEQIIAEVDHAGVTLVVSLPRLYDGYTLAIDELLAGGELGEVTSVRTRLSHGGALGKAWLPERFFDPEQCGGGAMVDLGCHPMYLARHFLGQLPSSVNASYGHLTDRRVDDNAVVTLHCENGALGVVEAGFVNRHSPFSIEVHGTEGSLLYGLPDSRLVAKTTTRSDSGWVQIPVPEGTEKPFAQFVSHVEAGTTADENVAAALDLTRLMEAANASAVSHSSVRPK